MTETGEGGGRSCRAGLGGAREVGDPRRPRWLWPRVSSRGHADRSALGLSPPGPGLHEDVLSGAEAAAAGGTGAGARGPAGG